MSAAMVLAMSSCGKNNNEQVPETAVTEEGKKTVKMYVWNTNSDIEKAAGDFNGKSSEYRVEITDYTEKYPDEPLTHLSNDIIIGNLPDIILLDSYSMPVESYIAKGLFANLYDFMDSEEANGLFPIKRSVFESLAEKAKERPYYENDDGIKVYYEKTWWNGSYTVNIGVNTDEDNKRVTDFINSVENISRYDMQINSIINDEAAAYFDGRKSAKEAAEVIQSRVQNYLDESR